MLFFTLLLLAITSYAQEDSAPQPELLNVTYNGNGCPSNSVIATMSAINATTNIALLTFTLSAFAPDYGPGVPSDDKTQRCNVSASIAVDLGWKIMVNARGTEAKGYARLLNRSTTLEAEGTYAFAEKPGVQSSGQLIIEGPLSGRFDKRVEPNDGDQGIIGPCKGGVLEADFQSSVISSSTKALDVVANSGEDWAFSTDVEVSWC